MMGGLQALVQGLGAPAKRPILFYVLNKKDNFNHAKWYQIIS
jgi:hypothetical protein